jgi:hypothetical protein
VKFLLVVMLAFPLAAQLRDDCVSEEITGDRFHDVCGSDRQTLEGFNKRIAAASELRGTAAVAALRQIQCDVASEDDTIRALVQRSIEYAATDFQGDEESMLALIEADISPFMMRANLPHASDRAITRLQRVANDRTAGEDQRCAAIYLLQSVRGTDAIRKWTDVSCAAKLLVNELTDDQRREILAHRDHPLFIEVLLGDRPGDRRIDLLCSVASDAKLDVWTRLRAIGLVNSSEAPEAAACLETLLAPENWFTYGRHHSAAMVIDALATSHRARMRTLLTTFDTSGIADTDMRDEVDEAFFNLHAFDPDAPYFEADAFTPP